jgi:short-subunit dehydrogenase involved in D-alanine esterification of teichoic acids
MNLHGHKTLVLGASSSVGTQLANFFSQHGSEVVLSDKDLNKLWPLSERLNADVIPCDPTLESDVHNLISEMHQVHPDVSIIINSLCSQTKYTILSDKEIDELLMNDVKINFTTPIQIIHGLLPLLIDQKKSAIIQISQKSTENEIYDPINIGMTSGLHLFLESLRKELLESYVKVLDWTLPFKRPGNSIQVYTDQLFAQITRALEYEFNESGKLQGSLSIVLKRFFGYLN